MSTLLEINEVQWEISQNIIKCYVAFYSPRIHIITLPMYESKPGDILDTGHYVD